MNGSDAVDQTITTLSTVLPPLISAAGLNALDQYTANPPRNTEASLLACYISNEKDNSEMQSFSLIVQVQLYGVGNGDLKAYHKVIYEAIRQNLPANLYGMTARESIEADIFPVDQRGSSFIYYDLMYSRDYDDCEY